MITIFVTVEYFVTDFVTIINIMKNDFKARLRELRIEKNISQYELSKMLNMSKMAISHWEAGHSEPSIAQLIALSKLFNVTVDYLIGNVDLM